MCLAVPGEVIELEEGVSAVVDIAGARRRVSVALVDGVAVGDYVLVHAGFAIEIVDKQEAERTMELFEELAWLTESDEIR